jgi:hypothetical protein
VSILLTTCFLELSRFIHDTGSSAWFLRYETNFFKEENNLAGSYDGLFASRHPELKSKDENWKLIYNSYIGGVAFKNANYLIKYPKESTSSFDARKKRAVYFNQVSPIVDMLSGLLFLNQPTRNIPPDMKYLMEDISGDKKINEFMHIVSAHTFMFTCGVLVDSPNYNQDEILTEKDRLDKNIHPYATLYLPFRIRDFNININDGELDWVLLDNSYTDHTDPFSESVEIVRYTLWTRTGHRDFERQGKQGEIQASTEEEIPHNIGYVPFRFASWRDDNNDFVSETVCEDIAMISKLVYNNLSYMDEMLAAGTFKMLAYPSKTGEVPTSLIAGGVGNLGILPYDMSSSTIPSFIGASLSDVDPFIKAIEFYMSEILKKVGLGTDETKEFVKSGAAKKIDFQKMRALLLSGALMMSKLEEWIFVTAAKWEGKDKIELKIEYTSAFSDEDLQTEVTMLTELLVHPVKKLRIGVLNLLAKKLLANNLSQEVLNEIYKDVETSVNSGQFDNMNKSKVDVQSVVDRIKSSNSLKNSDSDDK